MRLFLAMELSDGARAELTRLIEAGRASNFGKQVNWVRPENLHLTIQFLGDVEEGRLPELIGLLKAIRPDGNIRAQLSKLLIFPERGSPRVIGVALEGEIERLGAVQLECEDVARAMGLATEDREFKAHVTLGRARREVRINRHEVENFEVFGSMAKVPVEFREVVLFRSHLSSSGPTYEKVGRFQLSALRV